MFKRDYNENGETDGAMCEDVALAKILFLRRVQRFTLRRYVSRMSLSKCL